MSSDSRPNVYSLKRTAVMISKRRIDPFKNQRNDKNRKRIVTLNTYTVYFSRENRILYRESRDPFIQIR